LPPIDQLLSQTAWREALPELSRFLSTSLPASWRVDISTTTNDDVQIRLSTARGEVRSAARSLQELRHLTVATPDDVELLDALLNGRHIHSREMPPKQERVRTRRHDRLADALLSGEDVLLVGSSASGKTVSAEIAAQDLAARGASSVWLDFAQPDLDVGSLVCGLIRASRSDRLLIVFDNLQASPEMAAGMLTTCVGYRRSAGIPIAILVCTWPSAAAIAEDALPSARRMTCSGMETVISIAADAFPNDAERREMVITSAGRDAVVAHLLAQLLANQSDATMVSRAVLAQYAFERQFGEVPETALAALRWWAALGALEIEVPEGFGRIRWADQTTVLLECGALRRNGGLLSLGHRSLCALVFDHLSEVVGTPFSVVREAVEFLRSAGSEQIRATLARIDLVGLQARPDQHGTAFLARAWRSADALGRIVAAETRRDPAWSHNTASSVFAARVLAALGESELCRRVVSVASGWWSLSETALPVPIGPSSPAERVDFDEILKCMQEEDGFGASAWSEIRASRVDLDRMHRTWVLGLLLGAASTGQLAAESVTRLYRAAATVKLTNGAFYPDRVPWVTARVILGLVDAGHSYETSDLVRDACDWLVQQPPVGPCSFGVWSSGTGRWNSDVMTSAMCMLALARAGYAGNAYDPADTVAFMLDKRADWLRPGREIDAALAVEALLAARVSWRQVQNEILWILQWANDIEAWTDLELTASESQTESSKVVFVASSIVEIVWDVVRDELPLLLEGVALASLPSAETATPGAGAASGSPSNSAMIADLDALADYCEDEERVRLAALASGNGIPMPSIQNELMQWRERLARLRTARKQIEAGDAPQEYERDLLDVAREVGFPADVLKSQHRHL